MSIQEGDAEVTDFIDRYGLAYPFLLDRTGQTSATYQIATTPTTYFIAPDGSIADTLAGVVDRDWLEGNIENYVKN